MQWNIVFPDCCVQGNIVFPDYVVCNGISFSLTGCVQWTVYNAGG